MTIFKKEMRKGLKSFAIWTGAIAAMMIICVLIYPEMEMEMSEMGDIFSNMGAFTQAFGMDQLNFGTLMGFYAVECGNVLGLGGGLFAAYIGITMLSKEEKEHTAEFLMTHPVKRSKVLTQKLLAVVDQIVALNLIIFVCGVGSILIIGEDLPMKEMVLIHGAYLLMQLELGLICFGVSAFVSRGSIGIGMGIAGLMYFLNLIKNITPDGEALKYVTPYAYAEASDIIENLSLDVKLIAIGMAYGVVACAIGYFKYTHKDIRA